MNVGIFSINENVYSETFIAAHKNLLQGHIFYYHGNSYESLQIERLHKPIAGFRLKQRVFMKLSKSYRKKHTRCDLIKRSLLENKIDVILVEYGTLAYSMLPLFKIIDIPFIVHFHGYDASVNTIIESCKNYKEVFQKASAIISVSKQMESNLLGLGCPKEKLYYNPYGPNDCFLEVESTCKTETLIGIGRFVDKKAPYLTILAFNKALKEVPSAKLVMAGNGPLLNTCQNLVAYLGLVNSVSFPGVISASEFTEFLVNSRAYVQHSITASNGDMEGTPLAILEAQASSVPVISTLHAGIKDVVINNETGILVEEKDVDGMARGMITLLQNINLAKQMGRKAKEDITENFSMAKHINGINQIIIKVTKQN